MLYLIGIGITFFLVLILISKKGKSKADYILAIWLFIIGIHLSLFYLFVTGINFKYPFLLGIEAPMPFLHGPLLFLYIRELTNIKTKKRMVYFIHFLPYILGLMALTPFFILSHQEKITVYNKSGEPFRFLLDTFFILFIISALFYTALSVDKLLKYRKSITDYFSDIEKINLQWLLYLTIGLSAIWLVVIFTSEDKFIFTSVVLYVIFIGYFGIKQVGIFTNSLLDASQKISPNYELDYQINSNDSEIELKVKYEKSGLTEEEINAIHVKLNELMHAEKLYKNPELTLPELAKKLSVHPNALSQVINSKEQKNFYDYINIKRVEEFKAICKNPENQKFTLLALAFECGFNSKTSFNRNFKKVTQVSPSEYLKETNINLQ